MPRKQRRKKPQARAELPLDPALKALEEAALAYRRDATEAARERLAELAFPVAQRIARTAWAKLAECAGRPLSAIESDAPAGEGLFSAIDSWLRTGREKLGFMGLLTMRIRDRVKTEFRYRCWPRAWPR